MPHPLPPPKKETRRHPRYELFASVELHRGQETVVLPARDISLGGLFLKADGNDLGHVSVGDFVELVLFDMNDDGEPTVRADAQVVRCDADGMALTWASTDPIVSRKLANVLERLNPV